jgi:DHA1 family chloramphenicol resistance protein-like MFS transporter
MFNVAGAAPTLAGATTTAAFNLGNTSGPWLGGAVIDADFGFEATAWAGAAMMVVALVAVVCSLRLQGGGRSRRVTGAPATVSSGVSAKEGAPARQAAAVEACADASPSAG